MRFLRLCGVGLALVSNCESEHRAALPGEKATVAASRDSQRATQPQPPSPAQFSARHRVQGPVSARSWVAQLVREDARARREPFCWANLVWREGSAGWYLTPAHCLSRQRPLSAHDFRLAPFLDDGAGIAKASLIAIDPLRMQVHPEFSAKHLSAARDIAAVRVDLHAVESARPVALTAPSLQVHSEVWLPAVADQVLHWHRAIVADVLPLSFTIERASMEICAGWSGAPVVTRDSLGEPTLVGMVSRGDRDCLDSIQAVGVRRALLELPGLPTVGKPPLASTSCSECLQLAGVDACVTPWGRCVRDSGCARALNAVDGTPDRVRRGPPLAGKRWTSLLRCGCYGSCSSACEPRCQQLLGSRDGF